MARSIKGSSQRPDTLMQDRTSANSMKVLLQRAAGPYIGVKTGSALAEHKTSAASANTDMCALSSTSAMTTLADLSRARDSQVTFTVAHGWSAFWRGRPWLAGRRVGETRSDVGSSRFWIGWVAKHGDKCARSTCRD